MSHVPNANAMESLMYVMICVRPDISHAVGVFSGYMANRGKECWNAVKWVLQYVRGSHDYCITFNSCSDFVCDYVDSDFASDLDMSISTLVYAFTLVGRSIS